MLRPETTVLEAAQERFPCSLLGRGLPHAERILVHSQVVINEMVSRNSE